MWIRFGSFTVIVGRFDELRAAYIRTCAPRVREVPGNLDCYLMVNADDPGRCMVCTIWETEQAAKDYEASGTAMRIVETLRPYFAGPPVLTSYRVERTAPALA
jgi:quinol monooxygenase YgiN